MGRIGKPQKSKKHKKVRALDPLSQEEAGRSTHARNIQTNQKPRNMEQEIPRKAKWLMASMKGHEKKPFQQHAGIKKKRTKQKYKGDGVDAGIANSWKKKEDTFPGNKPDSPHHKKQLSKEVLQSADLIEQFQLDRRGNMDETKTKRAQKTKRRLKEHKHKEKEKRLEKNKEKERDFNQFKDNVQFGEVVHAPPMLSALPRKANSVPGVPRPGKKSLLLKEIITTNSSHNQGLPSAGSGGRRQLGQTVKRKHMSMAQQYAMDSERDKAIDLYRQMKNKKMKMFS